MKFILITLLWVCAFAQADVKNEEDLVEAAQREEWTFKFDANAKEYATGLLRHQTGLLKRGQKQMSDMLQGAIYESFLGDDVKLPDTYDLRDKISPIRNQGNCGSCWAFSLTATLRDTLILFGVDPGALSEQYLVDCATDMFGCNGGMPEAAKWHITPKGAPLLSDYPYTARNGRCQKKTIAGSALEWHFVGASNRKPSTDEIKKAIYQYGPVSVTVGANGRFMAYKSGVFNACQNAPINHMTNLVGWDKDGWIMRNSWGTNWGEQGFMHIVFTDKAGNKCNNIGDETVFYKVAEKPIPPTPKEFAMTSKKLTLKVTLKVTAKYSVDQAKKVLQSFLDAFDKR